MDFAINKNLTKVNYNTGSISRIKYIVVHYTGNDGDTAYGNTQYFKSVNRGASAHYFVDAKSVWQCVEDKNIAWHCGTTGKYYHPYCRNANSLGVELCSRQDSKGKYYFEDKTVDMAVKVIKYLMQLYNVPAQNVVRHYDVTHKNCPAPFVENPALWTAFKERLAGKEDDEVVDTTEIEVNGKIIKIDRILKDGKNYIALTGLEYAGFNIGYNPENKIPSLENAAGKVSAVVDGAEKELESVNIKGYNYCKLRDVGEATGYFDLGYKDGKVVIDKKQG